MADTVLVTGGAGFIGSEFVRQAVENGLYPIVVDRLTYSGDLRRLSPVIGNFKFYEANTANYSEILEIFNQEKPSIVVHFAAESHVDRSIFEPHAFIDSNIKGTLNLLEASKELAVRLFINISTDEVYGELGTQGYFSEDSPLKPNSPYAVSKAAQDMLGRSYYKTFGLPVATVRPSNNYGPWQYPEKLIPLAIFKAIHLEEIPIYGNGENIREWLFVSDCIEGIFKVLESGKPGEVYNIGSGIELKNIDVVKKICRILDDLIPQKKPYESLITFVKDRPGHDFRYGLDSSKIQYELHFQAHTSFEEGLYKTVTWYLKNREWLEEKASKLRDFWTKNYKK
ncbi:MAG: dTDP-glucose 4,6-dehydratase [Candidatus Hydrothermae bacterium]|nr:dTDP-glucose 4,6-dehydratase [Candidatus Hydrothermae bacterium]